MFLFRKKPPNTMPAQAMEYRKETHRAAEQAKDSVALLNSVMMNGITVKIYHATGGRKK